MTHTEKSFIPGSNASLGTRQQEVSHPLAVYTSRWDEMIFDMKEERKLA